MPTTIIQRVISAVADNAISISNAQFGRLITLPVGWSQIRVGIRLHMTDSGINFGGTPRLALGFGHGVTNMVGGVTCDHFVGMISMAPTWIRNVATYSIGSTSYSPAVKVGAVLTTGADMVASGTVYIGNQAAAAAADRTCIFLNLLKGAPNYDFRAFVGISNAPADVSAATFLAQMQTDPPALANHQYSAVAQVLAVDEATNGVLNAVQVWWSEATVALEISDLAVAVLA